MKNKYLLFATVCLFGVHGVVCGQSGVVPLGGNLNNSAGSVSYSLGQIADEYQQTDGASVNEGIQQSYLTMELIDQHIFNISISVYPNPTIDEFSIKVEDYNDELRYSLYTANGQLLQNGTMRELQKVDMRRYALGSYMLRINTIDNKQENTYKIIKGH